MRHVTRIAVLLAFLAPLTGCAEPGEDELMEEEQQQAEQMGEQQPGQQPGQQQPGQQQEFGAGADVDTTTQTQRREAAGAAGAATLQIDSDTPFGSPYITDGQGKALYLFTADQQGESTCYDRCAEVWPPFAAGQGTPEAQGEELQADLIDTIERRDGTMQVTYNGHPLYHYVTDEAGAERPVGQDVEGFGGEWYLVTPSGEPLQAEGGGSGSEGGS